MEELHQTADHLVDCLDVAALGMVKPVAGRRIRRQKRTPKQVEQLGEVVEREPVALREAPVSQLGHLPARKEAMDALEERRIDQLLGQRLEEVVVLLVGRASEDVEVADE